MSAAKIAVAPSNSVISSGVLQGEEVKFDSSITALLLELLYAESWRIYQHFEYVYVQRHVCADVMFMLRMQGM